MLEQLTSPQHDIVHTETMADTPGMSHGSEAAHEGAAALYGAAPLVRVGKWLKGLREQRGLSQTALARLCHVTSAHLSQIEKGRRFPADALCLQLAQHLGCDPRELSWRVRAEKSPALANLLSVQRSASSTRSTDPRIEALAQTLQDLRQTIPAERYERLLATIFGVLSPYEDFVETVPRRHSTLSPETSPTTGGETHATKQTS